MGIIMSPRCKKPRNCKCKFKGKAFKPTGVLITEIKQIPLLREKIISPANGILFIIGATLMVLSPPWPYVLMIIGGVLFGIALVWLGVSIRTGQNHDTLESTLRIHDECLAQAEVRA